MPAQNIGCHAIVDGPSKFDMLLSMYDSPREIRFVLRSMDEGGNQLIAKSKVQSSTLRSDGRWIIIGTVAVRTVGLGERDVPMYADYDPQSLKGTMTINQTGKGAIVLYFPPKKQPMIRLDLGMHREE